MTSKLELSWLTLVPGAFALVGATAFATWQIRADRLEELGEQLSFYEQASSTDFGASLNSVTRATEALEERLSSLSHLESLQPRLQELESRNTELENNVSSLESEIAEFEARMAAMYASTGSLKIWEGRVGYIGERQVSIGVVAANGATHVATINLNGERVDLEVGAIAPFVMNDSSCRLLLDSADYVYEEGNDLAVFSYVCEK